MKTIVYIDGFNLYFGCLKHTPYKWLDVGKLAHRLCKEQNPASEIISVKYFTAEIKAKVEPRGHASCEAQKDYLRALEIHATDVEIIKGKYFVTDTTFFRHSDPVNFSDRVRVWKPEEKQTDVKIAIQMLRDAAKTDCSQMVLFSNDSDLAPALQALKEDAPHVTIGTVTPLRCDGDRPLDRNTSADLKKYSDWLRSGIREQELADSQLPTWVLSRKRKFTKPEHW